MARAGDNRFFYAFDTIGIILLSVGFYMSVTYIKKRYPKVSRAHASQHCVNTE